MLTFDKAIEKILSLPDSSVDLPDSIIGSTHKFAVASNEYVQGIIEVGINVKNDEKAFRLKRDLIDAIDAIEIDECSKPFNIHNFK